MWLHLLAVHVSHRIYLSAFSNPGNILLHVTATKMSGEERLVTEVPSSLKQLARLVVRGFYTIEDALIVDMLVRNPCEYIADMTRCYIPNNTSALCRQV